MTTNISCIGTQDTLTHVKKVLAEAGGDWKVEGAESADAVLARAASGDVHIALAESNSSSVDAGALFNQLRERHPGVIRLAYSVGVANNAAPAAAQRVICSRESTEQLVTLLERAALLHGAMNSERLTEIIGALDRLPSVPSTYHELNQAAAKPDTSMQDLAAIVQKDPALSLKVLQMANSARFGVSRRLASIPEAVTYLGINPIKGLVLSAHVFMAFETEAPRGFSLEAFQSYSTKVAGLAQKFVAKRGLGDAAFAAGLLHDIGKLILAVRHPEASAAALQRATETGETVSDVERDVFGVTHAEVGTYLLSTWGLPLELMEVVAFHHTPSVVQKGEREVLAAVHAADLLTGVYACGEPEREFDETFLRRTGFDSMIPNWRKLAEQAANG
ncbi:MAG: HDOD domain-containing protein [Polyangiaceae bacterium]